MISTKSFAVFALLVGGVAKPAHSTELQSATITAWQVYVRSSDASMQARLDTDKPFLWIDEMNIQPATPEQLGMPMLKAVTELPGRRLLLGN